MMMTKHTILRRAAALLVILTGLSSLACAGLFTPYGKAEMVMREPARGVYALKGDRGRAWLDLKNKANAHCGAGGYDIVREENVVVGQRTRTDTNVNRHRTTRRGQTRHRNHTHNRTTRSNYTNRSTTSTTKDMTQYQITYVCRQARNTLPVPATPAP